MAESAHIKLAIVGGGSQFMPSILNGLADALCAPGRQFRAELALYDVRPEAAERQARYAEVVARAYGLPLTASVPATRDEALAGADLVLLSVWLAEEHRRAQALAQRVGLDPAEDGPAQIAEALSLAPFCRQLGADMARLCPRALFMGLVNPTDILPRIVEGSSGVRSLGLCVEVEGMRGLLSYHLGLGRDELALDHVGVNHDGWVLRMRARGEDAYPLWAQAAARLAEDPDYHPHAHSGLALYRLTGYLRTSPYHHLPWGYQHPAWAAERLAAAWPDKRRLYAGALEQALQTGEPIVDPWPQHPERSPLNYPFTGRQIGRLARAVATGEPYLSPLQVRNGGAISNWPDETTVEVPVLVGGRSVQPLAMGEAPEWLCGPARLAAVQRRLVADYALQGDPALLHRALAAVPWAAGLPVLEACAQELHRMYGEWARV